MVNFSISLLMFLFIFNIPFKFLPFGTGKILTIIGFIIIFLCITLRKSLNWCITREVKLFFKYSLFLLIGSFFITIINKAYDFSVSYAYVLFIIEHLLGGLVIVYILGAINKLDLEYFFKKFINICLIQSIIIIIMLINNRAKNFVHSIVKNGDKLIDISLRYEGIRGLGIAANNTYELSFVLSISLIFIVYLINRVKSKKENIYLVFSYIIISFSVISVGRTGIIGIFLSLIFLIISNGSILKLRKRNVKFIVYILIILCIGILSLATIFKDIYVIIKDKIIPFAFEIFINLFKNGKFETASTNILFDMYFPVSIKTLILGDGRYIGESGIGYYMSTDAGYMRHVLFSGIWSIFIYIFYFKIAKFVIKNSKEKYGYLLCKMSFLVIVYYFIVHMKGDILVGGNMSIKVLTLFLLISAFKKNE